MELVIEPAPTAGRELRRWRLCQSPKMPWLLRGRGVRSEDMVQNSRTRPNQTGDSGARAKTSTDPIQTPCDRLDQSQPARLRAERFVPSKSSSRSLLSFGD